jgi:hypothetical protein
LDICKKVVPLHKYYGHKPGAERSDSSKSIFTPTVHGSKGFAIVEKYADTPELQALASKRWKRRLRRWRYMNSVYRHAPQVRKTTRRLCKPDHDKIHSSVKKRQ